MEYQWKSSSLNELPEIAENILSHISNRKLALTGELGSGKTTLIKEICRVLGILEVVTSPTFTILNEYSGKGFRVFHFDLYRIEKIEEIYDLGYEEYLFSNEYVFVEWPDKLEGLLPDFYNLLNIEIPDNRERIYSLHQPAI